MKQSIIAIIGSGTVGSMVADALMMRNFVAKIILVDSDEKRCEGEVQDLSDAVPFSGVSEIVHGTVHDARQADIVVIAAGIAQKQGQSRLELLATNKKIVASIITQMQPINPQTIIIVVTNPVDILTLVVQELSGLPRRQVFGSGTMLDTQRLRGLIGKKIAIDPRSIHVYVIGEHGDSQCVAWSCADVAGIPLLDFPGLTEKYLADLAVHSRQKVYDIIACKGSTAFGVASCVSAYCNNILLDQKRVVPVSCFVESFGVCLSMPVVLGRNGIEQMLNIPLHENEYSALKESAQVIRSLYDQLS